MTDNANPSFNETTPTDYGAMGETFIEHVSSMAFIEDFLFRSPKYRRGKQQKELCDLLVLFDDTCILIEVKTADHAAHRGWTMEEEERWANAEIRDATKQLRGALRAVCKGLVTTVENKYQGKVSLNDLAISSYFAIAIVDHLPMPQIGHIPDLVSGRVRCPLMQLSFQEFREMLHELASIPDLLDYLQFRQRFLIRSTFLQCTELDLLATFKSQYPSIDSALRSGNTIVLANNIWRKYAAMNRRRTRDKERWPSRFVDLVIRNMRGSVPVAIDAEDVEPKSADQPISPGALLVATQLNSLRRIERVAMGNTLVEKSQLCEISGRGRYFAHGADNSWLYVWYVSNENRVERRQVLVILTKLAQYHSRRLKAVGIAMNSFTRPGIEMSIDVVVHVLPDDFDWAQVPATDMDLVNRTFKPLRNAVSQEYGEWKPNKPGFDRFKTRGKRSR